MCLKDSRIARRLPRVGLAAARDARREHGLKGRLRTPSLSVRGATLVWHGLTRWDVYTSRVHESATRLGPGVRAAVGSGPADSRFHPPSPVLRHRRRTGRPDRPRPRLLADSLPMDERSTVSVDGRHGAIVLYRSNGGCGCKRGSPSGTSRPLRPPAREFSAISSSRRRRRARGIARARARSRAGARKRRPESDRRPEFRFALDCQLSH